MLLFTRKRSLTHPHNTEWHSTTYSSFHMHIYTFHSICLSFIALSFRANPWGAQWRCCIMDATLAVCVQRLHTHQPHTPRHWLWPQLSYSTGIKLDPTVNTNTRLHCQKHSASHFCSTQHYPHLLYPILLMPTRGGTAHKIDGPVHIAVLGSRFWVQFGTFLVQLLVQLLVF